MTTQVKPVMSTKDYSLIMLQRGRERESKREREACKMFFKKIGLTALAGVAQWTECQPANQKFASSVLSQITFLGCGTGPQLGACKRQSTHVSLIH